MPSSPIRFEPCARGDIGAYAAYLSSLSSPIDSFLEDHILASGFQRISQGGRELGFFATHPTGLLTQFHLIPAARRRAQAAYADILNAIRPTAAIVPTCDEFFLSHALDACSAVRKQAYFFTAIPGDDAAAGIRADLDFQVATASFLAEIAAVSADFLDDLAGRVGAGQIHLGRIGSELVAIGVVEPSRLFARQASIGMFTREDQRGRGIGRTMIRRLIASCRAEGVAPIAGCWYYNHASKRTLEAAGMVTATRLLRIEYAPDRPADGIPLSPVL